MYHNVLSAKDHPDAIELEKAVEFILTFSCVTSIYFSPHIEDDHNAGIVMVIISEDSPHSWDELNESYWKVFETFKQFSFRVFSVQWVKDELKDGNPFFAMHCTRNSLVYSTEETEEFEFTENLKKKRFLKKAKSKFQIEHHCAFIVGIDLRFYQKQRNHLQGAYNIHQNMRLLFIAAENFLTGEWLVDQDLSIHQMHLGKFSTSLGKVFDKEIPEDMELLKLLKGARRSVQCGEQVPNDLSAELIRMAEVKKEWLRAEVDRLFKECLCRCKFEFFRSKSPLIAIDKSDPLKLVVQIVSGAVDTLAIYCFGQRRTERSTLNFFKQGNGDNDYQTTHYYLFLIVDDFQADAPGNIAYNISARTAGRFTATLIMHSVKSLRQAHGDQQHFLYQVMQGRLLFQEAAKLPLPPIGKTPARNLTAAKSYWTERQNAIDFLMRTVNSSGSRATTITVYFMQIAIEQTCLGLIRVFLGYAPNQFSLKHLFELCELFSVLTAEVFPRKTDYDKKLLRVLSAGAGTMRYGIANNFSQHDFEVLRCRQHEFVKQARRLAELELERLQQLNDKIVNT
ncbi:hypothetical protein [Pedobacter sp. ASV28]|uniref:hypothetical protein n=1 Tax=Pedobacter sp. ASV28 TaxID=2795123 RepID=UPI0018ED818F|nr:hypothetical protein [Pedobacter sp. ASV28]